MKRIKKVKGEKVLCLALTLLMISVSTFSFETETAYADIATATESGTEVSVNQDTIVVKQPVIENNGRRELHMSVDDESLEFLLEQESEKEYGMLRWYFMGSRQPDLTSIKITKSQMKKTYNNTTSPLEIRTELGRVILDEDVMRALVKKAKSDTVEIVMEKLSLSKDQQEIFGEDAYGVKVYFKSAGKKITSMDYIYMDIQIEMRQGGNPSSLSVGRIATNGKVTESDCTFGGQVGNVQCKVHTRYLGTFIVSSNVRIAYAKKVSGIRTTTIKAKAQAANRSVTISWTKSKGYGVDGYQVYRSAKKSGNYSKIVSTNKKAYKHSGLKSGSRHYYKVRGYKTIGGKKYYTKWSAVVSATAK